jgi:hypothetical protein
MELWDHLPAKFRVIFLILLFFLFLISGLLLYPKMRKVKEPVEVVISPKIKQVTIYITGMVRNPGVYTLNKGKRVIDAIKKAGGPLKGWDPQKINLARKLRDQEMIVVPHVLPGIRNLKNLLCIIREAASKSKIVKRRNGEDSWHHSWHEYRKRYWYHRRYRYHKSHRDHSPYLRN